MSRSDTPEPDPSGAVAVDEIPKLVKEALITEHSESQADCVRGYVPSQSIQVLMEYLDADQIQQLTAARMVTDSTESFDAPSADLPTYVGVEEQLKRRLTIDYDRSKSTTFDWPKIRDYLTDSGLADVAIRKLVIRMENPDLRDHLFDLLQTAINYPDSYRGEFSDPFYFVMESRAPELKKDYDNIDGAHDNGYLQKLGWGNRTLDLVAIWSQHGWTKSGGQPFYQTTQHEVEELAFNQRESDRPVFGAVNSKLVVNRWRTPFGNKMTDLRYYDWEEDQQGWVRSR